MNPELLLKAAKAIRRRERRAAVKQMSDDQLEQSIRSSPLWSTLGAAADEPVTGNHIKTLARNRLVAWTLGINPEFPTMPLTDAERLEATERLAEFDRLPFDEWVSKHYPGGNK